MDAEPGCPLVVEVGDPVAALESVLGAGEDREAFVDVAVDLGELPRGVAVAEVVAPTAQNAVEILDRPLQRQPRVAALRASVNLASDRGHRPSRGPLLQIPATRLSPGLAHPMLEPQEREPLGTSCEMRDPGLVWMQAQPEHVEDRRHELA